MSEIAYAQKKEQVIEQVDLDHHPHVVMAEMAVHTAFAEMCNTVTEWGIPADPYAEELSNHAQGRLAVENAWELPPNLPEKKGSYKAQLMS